MPRWQLSLRFLLLGLMPVTGLAALAVRSGDKQLVHTGDPYDIAVEGDGYLCITDEFGETHQYVRDAKLTVNAYGNLCVRVEGQNRLLYPNITLPSDTTQFEIDPDGRVLTMQTGQLLLQQQGQLPLYVFSAKNIPELAPWVITAGDETGPPAEWNPGEGNAGYLRQAHRERSRLDVSWSALAMLAAGLVVGSLATALALHRPPIGQGTGDRRQETR